MSEQHSDKHEDVLQDLFVGDRSDDDREVVALLEECPVCRARAGKLRALTERIDSAAHQERAVLAKASDLKDVAGEERVAAVIRQQAAERDGGSGMGRIVRLGAVAAAVVLVVSLAILKLPGDGGTDGDASPGPTYLYEGEGIELLAPLEEVEAYVELAWNFELAAGGWVELRVYDAESGDELWHAEAGASPQPLPPGAAGWPPRIEWEAQAYNADGTRDGYVARAAAWLSSR